MIEWLDITCAPKDGTAVLLYVDGVAIEAKWDDQKRPDGSRYGGGVWRVEGVPSHGCGCCSSENSPATHWAVLNLPTTPKEGE